LAMDLVIYTDGGSRGNPGPAGAAFLLMGAGGKVIQGKGIFLGETTNNVAEYTGLLRALEAAKKQHADSVKVFSDSELMVRQINGQYKVKSDNLRGLFNECMEHLTAFSDWRVVHIEREKNEQADALANRAMDMQKDVSMKIEKNRTKGKNLRLGVLISGGGRTMVNIQKEIDAGNLNAEITVVICSRSTIKGIERAKELGLEPVIVRTKDFKDVESFSARLYEVLKEAKVDLVIQAGWLCLWRIPPEYENRVMNIHPALLPSFGGRGMWGHHVHEAVLKAGCKVSGCTVHFCTNEYDLGPIIVQRCCEVRDDDDADSLAARVFKEECIAYPEAIMLFSENMLKIKNQIVTKISSPTET
jgi:phosphoribosylglycinamide formyltransferase-1